jgi:2-phospho-L-lactate transferase/gluconeogenesis factor (CofD/UPF0052 family)
MKLVALAGGVGASKLLLGLARVMDPADLTIIANTGDDIELHGLHISPDLDIITYTLAGAVADGQGWGIAGDTFQALHALGRYGRDTWFNLGAPICTVPTCSAGGGRRPRWRTISGGPGAWWLAFSPPPITVWRAA